MSTMFTLYTFL